MLTMGLAFFKKLLLVTWVRIIYDFMVASFVRITHILRYNSEFTRYASLVNKWNQLHEVWKTTYTFWVVVKHNNSDYN